MSQVLKPVLVQAFIAELAVEALDIPGCLPLSQGDATFFQVAGFAGFAGQTKNPSTIGTGVLRIRCLAMTYSHMGKPHTTIGDDAFHD